MFNVPAVLSYTAVKNKRRIGKLKKKNESFSLFIILSLQLNMNFISVLCAKKICSSILIMFQVVCAVRHFIAIRLPSKQASLFDSTPR